jgi:formyltetrahydrofolate-dependent phosphoribosylglycinamide formyltransferase
MKRLVVMISGGGSNLQALIDACADGRIGAHIALVVSNRKNAFGLTRAAQANIPTWTAALKPYRDLHNDETAARHVYDVALAAHIAPYQPELIVLAGWMHILSPHFLNVFPRRVINLHPALPNTFIGINAIERAYESYTRGEITHSGVMVHYAIPEVDLGEVIVQSNVPFIAEDTLDTFAARMHAAEHQIIVEAVRMVLSQS